VCGVSEQHGAVAHERGEWCREIGNGVAENRRRLGVVEQCGNGVMPVAEEVPHPGQLPAGGTRFRHGRHGEPVDAPVGEWGDAEPQTVTPGLTRRVESDRAARHTPPGAVAGIAHSGVVRPECAGAAPDAVSRHHDVESDVGDALPGEHSFGGAGFHGGSEVQVRRVECAEQ
jgi:hypothetical protein